MTESDDEVSSPAPASLVFRTRLCFCSFSKRRCLFSGKTYLISADRTLCCRIKLLTSRAASVLLFTNLCSFCAFLYSLDPCMQQQKSSRNRGLEQTLIRQLVWYFALICLSHYTLLSVTLLVEMSFLSFGWLTRK